MESFSLFAYDSELVFQQLVKVIVKVIGPYMLYDYDHTGSEVIPGNAVSLPGTDQFSNLCRACADGSFRKFSFGTPTKLDILCYIEHL